MKKRLFEVVVRVMNLKSLLSAPRRLAQWVRKLPETLTALVEKIAFER